MFKAGESVFFFAQKEITNTHEAKRMKALQTTR